MATPRLTPTAQRLLADHVHSVLMLELLLHVHGRPEVWHAPAAVSRELRAPEGWVEAQLAGFAASGILECAPGDGTYHFAASGPWAPAVAEVAEAFRRRRSAVIGLIFDPGPSDARSFSDAFRLRGDD